MKNVFMLVFCLLASSLLSLAQPYPILVVKSGEIKTLPPRTFIYAKIDIQFGGRLIISPNSAEWAFLVCQGDIYINGAIEYKGFKNGSNTYTSITPQGEVLTHKFSEPNKGGAGGNGGSSACSLHGAGSVYASGGNGALGSESNGGGGGAGGGKRTWDNCSGQVTKGNDAVGRTGGLPIPIDFFSPRGGDGAVRADYTYGGLLYIYCKGNFYGAGGMIDVRGWPGNIGGNGLDNTPPYNIQGGAGGGGGGGGAPGGEGGVVILKIIGTADTYPDVLVNGGAGGPGGKGGRGFNNIQNIPTSNGGDGQPGQDGQTGLIEIRH